VNKILLDTNAYTALMAGSGEIFIALSSAETVYLSVIVLGELLEGFKGGSRESENKKRLEKFWKNQRLKYLP